MEEQAPEAEETSDDGQAVQNEVDGDSTYYYRFELLTSDPDAVSEALIKLDSVHGTQLEDPEDAPALTRVIFYWTEDRPAAAWIIKDQVEFYFSMLPDYGVEIEDCELFSDESWKDAWKRFFEPTMVAPGVRVGPPWDDFEAPDDGVKLVINPAMAFGTGTHETTQLSAAMLRNALEAPAPPTTVLDVGCGSAILSMIAARFGAERVLGIDIDEDALANARENLETNELSESVELSSRPVEEIDETFEVVVANILSPILMDLRDELIQRVRPGGALILSGIGSEHDEQFRAEFFDDRWEIDEMRSDGMWVAIRARRTSTPD